VLLAVEGEQRERVKGPARRAELMLLKEKHQQIRQVGQAGMMGKRAL